MRIFAADSSGPILVLNVKTRLKNKDTQSSLFFSLTQLPSTPATFPCLFLQKWSTGILGLFPENSGVSLTGVSSHPPLAVPVIRSVHLFASLIEFPSGRRASTLQVASETWSHFRSHAVFWSLLVWSGCRGDGGGRGHNYCRFIFHSFDPFIYLARMKNQCCREEMRLDGILEEKLHPFLIMTVTLQSMKRTNTLQEIILKKGDIAHQSDFAFF